MRILGPVDEAEVISAFIRAERESPRFSRQVRALLDKHGGDERATLVEHRGWGMGEGLFDGFPAEIHWSRAALAPDEILDILFIDGAGGCTSPTKHVSRVSPRSGFERVSSRGWRSNPTSRSRLPQRRIQS